VTETQGWLLIAAVLLVGMTGWARNVAAVAYLFAVVWVIAEDRRKRKDSPPR
jgi:hypothetical protein